MVSLLAIVVQFPHLGVPHFHGEVGGRAFIVSGGFVRRGSECRAVKLLPHHADQAQKYHKAGNLRHTNFLDVVARIGFTRIAGAEFSLFAEEQIVNLAAQTNAKSRFKKHQHHAGRTHQHIDRPDYSIEYHQVKHQQRQGKPDNPRKAFLGCADVFGGLIPHRQTISLYTNQSCPNSLAI